MSSSNTLGKYQIVREIARSNDIVYEAIDPTLGRRVALKELYLPPNLTGAQRRERIERFLREGKAAGRLAHPNIVTVYDVGQDGDRLYIAMEYLEGQTLREVLQVRGALPVKEAVDIAIQLCRALAYAHSNNIVHRDVKPENIQILPGGLVKLTDFGIARITTEPSITADGQVFGTPSYMSPEQVAGRDIDARSDIFSVGVVLYEMLAGCKPFTGDTVVTITYNIMNSEPPAPVGVSPYLVGIIRKAMAKDPDFRYQTADEMLADLQKPITDGVIVDTYTVPPAAGSTTFQPPTSAPTSNTGAVGQAMPDPFAQSGGAQYVPQIPDVMPRRPLISAETKMFIGSLMIALGLTGMFIFAIWAVGQAYHAYTERAQTETARIYISQGDRLYSEGNTDGAIKQYNEAVRAGGSSQGGKEARRRLSDLYSRFAGEAFLSGDYARCAEYAKQAISYYDRSSAGHYYLGVSKLKLGDVRAAEDELKKALDVGGNDDFAKYARRDLSVLYIQRGDQALAANRTEDARKAYEAAVELGDPDYANTAQVKLSSLQNPSP